MALDRPTHRPDRPEPEPTPEIPSQTRADAWASHRYWNETARFSAVWRDHTDRWPQHPSRDHQERAQSDRANAATEQVKRAEGDISKDIEQAARDCSHRAWLGGFEHRLKGAARIREKIAEKLSAEPDKSPMEAAQAMPDAIRYTFCFDTGKYSNGFTDIKDRLQGLGYQMYYLKNYWLNSEYKGVNSRWITPEGQRFEVQFHTGESFHAKHEGTHLAYERLRDPRTSDRERSELREFQREVARWVPIPEGAQEIANYRKEGF